VRQACWWLLSAHVRHELPLTATHPLSKPWQVLGANALLLHCLIDGVGAAARCAGLAFSSSSARLLRTSLLPLLERLADPCPLVASAAAGALASICRHTGYPLGLSQLVGANADYVVDGVCRQLRSLQQHPHAPQLLAALLREAGVSAALLPLLAEPLRAALSVSGCCCWPGGRGGLRPCTCFLALGQAARTRPRGAAAPLMASCRLSLHARCRRLPH
jgi:hypothetical protein